MDTSIPLSFFFLMILILLSAFFSSAETALTTVSQIRMRALAEEGNPQAVRVLKIIDRRDKMFSTILIGNNIVNLSASSLVTSLVIRLLGNAYVGVGTGIITFLILLFGEISPKTIAAYRAEKISLAYSGIIWFLMVLFTPVVFVVYGCAKLVLLPFHLNTREKKNTITEMELRTVLDVSHEEGVIEKDEHTMFHNVIAFGDTKAKDVMTPRIHIVSVPAAAAYEEILAVYRENRYTRLPVYGENPDTIIGVINVKDLLLQEKTDAGFTARSVLQEPYFTYENKSTLELLMDMRRDTPVMALVLDEYGELTGLLTIEDLLEEIVGKIHSSDEMRSEEELQKIAPRTYRVEGSMNLADFCEELSLALSSEDYDSLGGYIIEQLDRLPRAGDVVKTTDGITFLVESMEERRIKKVLVTLPEQKPAPSEDSEKKASGESTRKEAGV